LDLTTSGESSTGSAGYLLGDFVDNFLIGFNPGDWPKMSSFKTSRD